jgi:hypothetical protein
MSMGYVFVVLGMLGVVSWVLPVVVCRLYPVSRVMLSLVCLPIFIGLSAAIVAIFNSFSLRLRLVQADAEGAFFYEVVKLSSLASIGLAARIGQMKVVSK